MRHFLANIVTYAVAALLFIGSAAFAWMRSAQLALTDEATIVARYETTADTAFRWRELGEQSYARNCVNCHRGDGSGWDQYPPLNGTGAQFARPGGREYLIDLHLYGLTSHRWGAPMPRMGHVHDIELAAVLNHILTEFGAVPATAPLYLPEDVAARRGQRLGPRDVNAARPAVE
jgi:mono/diheme cytochrome c family protein